MGTLGAICAIFAAATGLDAEQTATLDLFAWPVLDMHGARLADEIEEWLVIQDREFFESHRIDESD